jgi:Rps23 Pro-64 3,4-dihydroxylase Tpa1-like proline 4-hydroxylase
MAKKTVKKVQQGASRSARSTIDLVEPLASWLAPKYQTPAALAKNAQTYVTAKPFPHIVLPGIFTPSKVTALRTAILALHKRGGFTHKESDLFSLAQTHDFRNEKTGPIAELVQFFKSAEWNAYLKALTHVSLSGKELDIGASLYTSTDYLLCHDDQVTGRKIAFIYYLCDDFAVTDGGALVLLDSKGKQPGKIVKRYAPKFNTLAMFTVSAKSWHAVEEVVSSKKRFSINGWFH